MSADRDLLLRILQERLIPMLLARGFEQLAFPATERSREIDFSFPFGYFRRIKGANVELLEIQLAKHDTAKFVLNFGSVPPEGADLPWKHYEQAEALVSALPEWYRLFSCRWSMKWFSPPWVSLPGDLVTRTTKAVDHAIDLYPEIEAWFATRTVGPHMRRVGYPIKPRQPSKG